MINKMQNSPIMPLFSVAIMLLIVGFVLIVATNYAPVGIGLIISGLAFLGLGFNALKNHRRGE